MKKISLLILITIIFLTSPSMAYAQVGASSAVGSKTSIGISPSISEIVMEDNKTMTQTINVVNLTNDKLPINVYAEGLSVQNKQDIPENLLNRYDASRWFKIKDQDKSFTLDAKASRDITVEVNKPDSASPGGNYATVIFQPVVNKGSSQDFVTVYPKLSAVFLLQVKGDIKESVKFNDLKVPTWINTQSLDYDLTIANTGNIHVRPLTKILVKEIISNKDYPSEEILPSMILPGLKGEFKGTDTNLPGIGIIKLTTQSTFGATNTLTESEDRYVLILPYWIVITLIGVLLL